MLRFWVAAWVCLAVTATAEAQRARFEMNGAAELAGGGFQRIAGGSSSFRKGVLRVTANGFEEWAIQRRFAHSPWGQLARGPAGWVVEARVRRAPSSAAPSCPDGGPGIWIHDGNRLLKVTVDRTSVGFAYPFVQRHPLRTDRWHWYRVEGAGQRVRLLVDGQVVIDVHGPETMSGAGTPALMFGDLGCSRATSYWDWLSYTIGAPFPAVAPTGARTRVVLDRIRQVLPPRTHGTLSALQLPDDAAMCVATLTADHAIRRALPFVLARAGRQDTAQLMTLRPLTDENALDAATIALHRLGAGRPRPPRPGPVGDEPNPTLERAWRGLQSHHRWQTQVHELPAAVVSLASVLRDLELADPGAAPIVDAYVADLAARAASPTAPCHATR